MKVQNILRSLLFCSVLLSGLPAIANIAPYFNGGSTINISGCMNSGAMSINGTLAVVDTDVAQTETWSVIMSPSHGGLGGFSTTAASTGGLVIPGGLSYSPTTGFTGLDTFIIQVSDGSAAASTMVIVNVRALPTLSSTLTPAAICDQSAFGYTPSSGTAGASFAWSRTYTPGISNTPTTGTGSISETLSNVTYYSVPVTYNFAITANGCTNHQNVVVNVRPTPRLSSTLYDTTCTTATYSYVPTSTVPGTTYSWTRASVAGISPATASGTGNITEVLTNSNATATTVVYTFTLDVSGCTAMRNLNVYVLPQPPVTTLTTKSPSSVCAGVMYQNFGAAIAPPAGVTYSWSAMNAEIYATGSNDQYALVNFPYAGSASVTLHISGGVGCGGNNTYAVTVSSAVSPSATIIHYNSQFVYLDNTASTYQWGYDDAATLDSTLIAGATFQSYPNVAPDVAHRYYWVMTSKNGCTQKTYYNTPVAITNVAPAEAATLKVYPNPATNTVSIELNGAQGNTTAVTLTNMLGQTVKSTSFAGNSVQLDITNVPAGCYLINCTQNGVRSVARFIKN